MNYTELLLGAGNNDKKKLVPRGLPLEFQNPYRVDIDPACGPDLVFDLNGIEGGMRGLPFTDGHFDEIHAYDVLEHVGQQGDWRGFFRLFSELHRVLKAGGVLCAITPSIQSRWAWGDPGHSRIIQPETLVFLSQRQYREQVGVTPMTDYRHVWKRDFEVLYSNDDGQRHAFVLRAA